MPFTPHTQYTLQLFGRAVLNGPAGPVTGRVTQRRRLALLAYLSLSPQGAASRDVLLALFWPEADAAQARHSLADTVYVIRKALGDDAVRSHGDDLQLDPARIACDVSAFEDALAQGDLLRAVELYAGPLLAGFHLSDAPEFERWVETERARVAGAYARALEGLAERESAREQHDAAVEWWRRLTVIEPYSARAALGLMRALTAAGERAAAIRHADAHAVLLQSEIGARPDPAVESFAEALRQNADAEVAQPAATVIAPADASAPTTAAAAPAAHPPESLKHFSSASAQPQGATTATARAAPALQRYASTRRRTSPVAASVALVAIMGALLGYRALAGGSTHNDTPLDAGAAVVLPFRLSGTDTALTYLREGLVELLATRLTGGGGLQSADPGAVLSAWRSGGGTAERDIPRAAALRLARDHAAGVLILGSVVGTPANLSINAAVIDVASGRTRATADVQGAEASLSALVDGLVARLLSVAAGEDERRLTALTSTSLPALRAYLDGRSAFRRGAYADAMTRFHTALQLDSNFVLAARSILGTGGWVGGTERLQQFAARRIRAVQGSASTSDTVARLGYTPASEELRSAEQNLEQAPLEPARWYSLGDELFHYGHFLRPHSWQDDAQSAFRRALELDSAYASPVHHLASLLARRGEHRALRDLAARHIQRDSTGDVAQYLRWLVAVSTQQTSTLPLSALDSFSIDGTLRWIGIETQDLGFALPYGRYAIAIRLNQPGTRAELFERRMGAFSLALNNGRPAEALRILERVRDVQQDPRSDARLTVLAALYAGGDTMAAARAARRLSEPAPHPDMTQLSRCVLDQWRVQRGESPIAWLPEAAPAARDSTREENQTGRLLSVERAVCAAVLAALIEKRATGTVGPATARLDSLLTGGPMEIAHVDRGQAEYAHLALAWLFEAAGQQEAALRALQRRARYLGWQPYLAIMLREEGRIAAALGDRETALRAYQHYLALQADPEPGVRAEVERVRSEQERILTN